MSKNRITDEKMLEALKTGAETRFLDCGRMMIDTLEHLGAEVVSDLEFNGWDCDFWATYKFEERYYSIFGCAFDGYVTIEEDKDFESEE